MTNCQIHFQVLNNNDLTSKPSFKFENKTDGQTKEEKQEIKNIPRTLLFVEYLTLNGSYLQILLQKFENVTIQNTIGAGLSYKFTDPKSPYTNN